MVEALSSVATGEVTVASRDAELDGIQIREGDFLGLVDETAVAAAEDMASVVEAVVARVLAGGREWLAILTGEGAPQLDGLVAALQRDHSELVIEVHDGGQPHYPLLVVAE
jgi:dihydroxyacetone kinase-like predicted kinase